MSAHEMTIRVRFGELDPYNHVNHAVYISYFEAARVELLADAGISLGRMRADGHSIVVSEIHTKFLASAEELDDLVIETEILEFRRANQRGVLIELYGGSEAARITGQVDGIQPISAELIPWPEGDERIERKGTTTLFDVQLGAGDAAGQALGEALQFQQAVTAEGLVVGADDLLLEERHDVTES